MSTAPSMLSRNSWLQQGSDRFDRFDRFDKKRVRI